MTSVANFFQLKVAKTGHLKLLGDLVKEFTDLYLYGFPCFTIKGEDVKFPRPDITFGHYYMAVY